MRPELAVIVPTLNEVGNIARLVELLEAALAGRSWEAIFVDDDSTDGTAERIYELAESRPNLRCLKRVGRRGLSSATVEGMMATGAPFLAVMDADLQHDERLLPVMLDRLKRENLDVVVASRFLPDSSLGDFSARRERLSGFGLQVARLIVRTPLSDPLSGYFMLRREVIEEVAGNLNLQGFKILVDIFASSPRPLAFAELPMTFRPRHSGRSKLDVAVGVEFLILVVDKLLKGFLPVRFVLFVLVGLTGVLVHLALLGLFFRGLGMDFLPSQVAATLIAMTSNFMLNNRITYRDRQLHGWAVLRGLISFYAACAIGAVMNFQIAEFLFERQVPWWMAGLVGAGLSSVWNYGVTSTFTWTRRRRRPHPLPRGREQLQDETNFIPPVYRQERAPNKGSANR